MKRLDELSRWYALENMRFSELESKRFKALLFGFISSLLGIVLLLGFGTLWMSFIAFITGDGFGDVLFVKFVAGFFNLAFAIIVGSIFFQQGVGQIRRNFPGTLSSEVAAWMFTLTGTAIFISLCMLCKNLLMEFLADGFEVEFEDMFVAFLVFVASMIVLGISSNLLKMPTRKYYQAYREQVHFEWIKKLDPKFTYEEGSRWTWSTSRKGMDDIVKDVITEFKEAEAEGKVVNTINSTSFHSSFLFSENNLLSFNTEQLLSLKADGLLLSGAFVTAKAVKGKNQIPETAGPRGRRSRRSRKSTSDIYEVFCGSMLQTYHEHEKGELLIRPREFMFTPRGEGWEKERQISELQTFQIWVRKSPANALLEQASSVVMQIREEWGFPVYLSITEKQVVILVEKGNYLLNGPLVHSLVDDQSVRETGSLIFGLKTLTEHLN